MPRPVRCGHILGCGPLCRNWGAKNLVELYFGTKGTSRAMEGSLRLQSIDLREFNERCVAVEIDDVVTANFATLMSCG